MQKEAYEIRISDWSSDGCSSDLIKPREFAGVDLRGRVRQTAAGPFDGQLFANGSGIDGTVQLSAAGSYQRADIHARANNAGLPAPAQLVIGRAIISGHAILYAAPVVGADVQFGQTPFGTRELKAARAHIQYHNGGRTDEGRGGREGL